MRLNVLGRTGFNFNSKGLLYEKQARNSLRALTVDPNRVED